jgi:phosphate transport system protein
MSGHLVASYDADLKDLRQRILTMGGLVEKMIADAVKSLVDRDTELAEQIIAMDHEVNGHEVAIDERCLELLALRQPTGRDLRFITLALKIVTDLERIGDKCANMAKRARQLNQEPPLKPYIDIPAWQHWVEVMIKEALDAFVRGDDVLAVKVCKDDQMVDDLNEQVQRELYTYMIEDPSTISRAMRLTYISKSLERIADHATNIAEMVIFMVKGKDIRHTIAVGDGLFRPGLKQLNPTYPPFKRGDLKLHTGLGRHSSVSSLGCCILKLPPLQRGIEGDLILNVTK